MHDTDYEVTPVMSHHTRERCAEMGISTKVAKRIWRTRMLTRPAAGPGERIMVLSPEHPEYAVIIALHPDPPVQDDRPLVVSIVFNCDEEYVRDGATFRLAGEVAA